MAPRTRIIAYGSAAAAVVLGAIVGVLIGGKTGEVVALTAGTLGLGAVILLVFLEIGLSEDRDRAKEDEERRRAQEHQAGGVEHGPEARKRLPRRPG